VIAATELQTRTPFVHQCWYIAALADELGEQLLERWILDQSILFFRRSDGTPVAFQNRCPHRSFPLSHGKRNGDHITCPYHGFTYNGDGRCISIPSQERIPPTFDLQSYPLIELGPFIWIWMGKPAAADPATIPDCAWLVDPTYAHVEGYFHMKADYLAGHENVLDLTHAPYLHGEDTATKNYAAIPPEITVTDDYVRVVRTEPDTLAPAHYAKAMGCEGHRVDRISDFIFASPAIHLGKGTIVDREPAESGRSEFHFPIIHAFTPESAATTHYFWSNARDSGVNDIELSRLIKARSTRVYQEDVDALELRQRILARDRRTSFREASVAADKAGLQMRRLVARLAVAENSLG
jgi:phenylpropionate dioxygenase-like ring-hydroxylating dioxygenase large terminal subunit